MKNRMFAYERTVGGILASLSVVLGLGSVVRAQVIDAPAKFGEIIVEVPRTMARADVDALAAQAGCVVAKPLAYSPGYYLFRQIGRATAPRTNAVTKKGRAAYVPDTSLKVAIDMLRGKPGVVADPNYLVELSDAPQVSPIKANRQSKSGLVPLGKTRATEPPSTDILQASDPYVVRNQMWGMEMIRMPEAWAVQASSLARPVLIEVIDSGIDASHPDLAGNLSPLSMNFTNDVPDNNIRDNIGHGTHVAGTADAVTNNATGVAGVAGYNGGGVNVKFFSGKVFEAGAGGTGTQSGTNVAIIEALNYGVSQKVDVVNMSLGAPGANGTPVSQFPQTMIDAFNNAFASGATICVSAGNATFFGTSFPADIPGAIKVSALNRQGTIAQYSNSGGAVAIAAPGGTGISEGDDDAIWSTWPSYTGVVDGPLITNYYSINGTSMACPHVAGVAALLVANGAVTPGVAGNNLIIKKIIQDSAAPIAGETPNPNGGNLYGAGRLDAYSAILPFANPPFTVSVAGAVSASVQQGTTTPLNAILAGDLPFLDRGITYSAQQNPLTIQVRGVSNKTVNDVITVELQTATTPSTTLRTFVSGAAGNNGFDVPTLATGQPKGTTFSVQVPRPGTPLPISVPDGRYKYVVKLNGVTRGIVFFEKISRSQPLGRALFSTPFQVRQVDANTPEQTLFGSGTGFSLARYNPLRLPSDFDYALFQSGSAGRSDAAARFSATGLGSIPLSFDTSNPSVSVAPVGLGYWLKLDSSVILNSAGPVVTNPVGVRCFAANGGWNMIGDPYTFEVAWASVTIVANNQTYSLADAVNAGIVSPALVSFVNNDYQYEVAPGGTLRPFNGYWVRVFQDCTIIIAPTGSPTSTGRAVNGSVGSAFASAWKVRFGASVDGDRDGQNFFGQVKGSGKSRLALPKPPSGSGHAYVRFVDSASRANAKNNSPMAYDLRPIAPGNEGATRETWTAEVSTDRPDTDVILTWDGIGTAPRRAGLFLTDSVTGQKISLRGQSQYKYKSGEAGSTRSFTISMEPQVTSGPLAIRNLTVSRFGRATGGGLAVRFTTTRDAEVTGVVRTLSGQVVGVLGGASRAAASSTTTMNWTGRAQNGSALPAGTYQIEVTVRDASGNTATEKQTVSSLR